MLQADKGLLTEITHVSSLKRDSPSIITFRRSGIGNRLKIASTATGSVAAKIAPRIIISVTAGKMNFRLKR